MIANASGAAKQREHLRRRMVRERPSHPDGRTAAVHIARQRQQFALGQHGYGFFACHSGRLLSVERRGDRRQKHITPAGLPGRNQRLEHTRRVLTESESYICAGDGAGIEMAVRYV